MLISTLLNSHICPNCSKTFKPSKFNKESAWFKKHEATCNSKARQVDLNRNINDDDIDNEAGNMFNFSDDYFSNHLQIETLFNLKLLKSDSDLSGFLKSHMNIGSFHIIHLNINSIFNKIEHVYCMLESAGPDIITLNKIKLDDSMSDRLFKHYWLFELLRRDRSSRGGGLMIYVKKSCILSNIQTSLDYEVLSFNLKINKKMINFICAYKPPNTNDTDHYSW